MPGPDPGARSSLRGTLVLGYVGVAVVVACLAGALVFGLHAIEDRVRLGEQASLLHEEVLELRRFERNYFLHRQDADLAANDRQSRQALALLEARSDDFVRMAGAAWSARLRALVAEYQARIRTLSARRDAPVEAAEERIRAAGREVVAMTAELASAERTQVRASLDGFRRATIVAIVLLFLAVVGAGWLVARRAVGPLAAMERDVQAMTAGRRARLVSPSADREFASVTGALNHLLDELEQRQRRLVRSEKLASLGTMLSGVAHELNNPLSNISTSCQILQEEGDGADSAMRARFLRQIDEQTVRARNIVRTLLEFARAGQSPRTDVPLGPLLEQAALAVRTELGVPCDFRVAVADGMVVRGDAQRLLQAFINLLRNAVEASAHGVPVFVSAVGRTIDRIGDDTVVPGCPLTGRVVDILIEDSGHGITPDALPRIFDPFFTTKDVGRGMGLGLFLTHEIVEEHEGCIHAAPRPGGGTSFRLRLPASSPAEGPRNRGGQEGAR